MPVFTSCSNTISHYGAVVDMNYTHLAKLRRFFELIVRVFFVFRPLYRAIIRYTPM